VHSSLNRIPLWCAWNLIARRSRLSEERLGCPPVGPAPDHRLRGSSTPGAYGQRSRSPATSISAVAAATSNVLFTSTRTSAGRFHRPAQGPRDRQDQQYTEVGAHHDLHREPRCLPEDLLMLGLGQRSRHGAIKTNGYGGTTGESTHADPHAAGIRPGRSRPQRAVVARGSP